MMAETKRIEKLPVSKQMLESFREALFQRKAQAAVQGLVALAASAALAALVKASVIYLICFLAVAAEAEGMVQNVAQTCVMTWMFLLRRQPSARKLS